MLQRLAMACALVVALALPVQAEVNGVYGGLKFIDSIQATGNVSNTGLGGAGISNYSQNTVGGGIFAGYDFYPKFQVPVRAEVEYALRSNMQTAWTGAMNGVNTNIDAKWNLQTLFANFYWDFHNSTAFTPYIGAGAGMGFISSNYDMSSGGNGAASSGGNHTVFAWNVGLGCSYAFTENLSADLGYRFVGLGGYEDTKTIGDQKMKISASPYANEISLGMRFTF